MRIYAWRSILSANGLVNYILMGLGLADGPRSYLMYTPWAVVLVLLNVYIPFATLPIFSALLNIERDVLDAASDLGREPAANVLAGDAAAAACPASWPPSASSSCSRRATS